MIRKTVLACAACLLLLAAPVAAVPIDDANPEASAAAVLKSGDPLALADLLQDLSARAERASQKKDFPAAAGYWRAATVAVPDRAPGFARLCNALEAAGQVEEALVACRTALVRKGTTAADYTHFVKLVLASAGPRPLAAEDRRQIDVALAQLDKEPAAALIAARVRCNVAAHEHDRAGLAACTSKLVAGAPEDASTIAFEWTLALENGDLAAAKVHQRRAVAAGLDRASLAPLALRTDGPPKTRAQRFVQWALSGLLVTLGLFAAYALAARVVAARRRRITVRA